MFSDQPLDPTSVEVARAGLVFFLFGIPPAILGVLWARRLWPWRETPARPRWGLPELLVVVLTYLAIGMVAGTVLRELYPDSGAYLACFEEAVRHGLDQGFILPRDALRLRAEASAVQIP